MLRALAAAFATSARDRLRARGDNLAACAFVLLLLFIFWRLWETVAAGSGLAGGYTVAQLLLYLVATEVVTLAPGALHDRVARDVRSGDLAVRLLRPVDVVSWELAVGLGVAAVRAALLLGVGVLAVSVFSGLPALDPRGIACALPLLAGAVVVESLARLLIGLSAFRVDDANPIYWIWQKSSFVLGGLMLPLDLYPAWLQEVARMLPFGAILGGPARTLVAWDPAVAADAALRLLAWGSVLALLVALSWSRAARRLHVDGG